MVEKLIEIMEGFGYPVLRQGSLPDDEDYPDTFLTFWNNGTSRTAHYDNASFAEAGTFDVNVYSTDPELAYSLMENVKEKFETNGYAIPDAGHDVASDEPSHIGRGITVSIITRRM